MLLVIVVSNRPCFAARFDQIFVVQVSDEFLISIEVLLNYLVICFESLHCVLQAVPARGGVLESVFLVVFCLLVSSKLNSYDVYASA
jgi:hypothetical protein